MSRNKQITVLKETICVQSIQKEDFISLTDIARYRDSERSDYILQNWLRNHSTIEFIGLWEKFNNPDFNSIEFDGIKNMAGSNSFSLTPKRWIKATNTIGIISKTGRYGGTFAHKDIAFEFASWLSAEFKFFFIKEFQRLKEEEQKQFGWDIRRNLTKINYRIHTDAIKTNLIPSKLSQKQINFVYASEADILNMALFGKTAQQWRKENSKQKGNIRDYANVSQLVCLANLENLNAHLIQEKVSQVERLRVLNNTAIHQMKLLIEDKGMKKFT